MPLARQINFGFFDASFGEHIVRNQRNLLLVFASATVAILASGCDKILGRDEDGVRDATETAVEGVNLVETEDTGCQSSYGALSSISGADIWVWNGTAAERKKVSLSSAAVTEGVITSSGVVGSVRDYELVVDCEYKDKAVSCSSEEQVKDQGQYIRFCRSEPSYGRTSIESMVLTTQYYVGAARKIYQDLTVAKASLMDAMILAQPRIIRNIKMPDGSYLRNMLSDNASFSTFQSNKKSYGLFSLYPSSKDYFLKGGVNLWEVPFVITHEYGHNIFHHHVGDAALKVSMKILNYGPTPTIMRERFQGVEKKLAENLNGNEGFSDSSGLESDNRNISLVIATTSAEKALNGINELFADLFSFVVLDEAENLTKGVPCLDKSRDPKSPKTSSGNTKSWSTSVDNIFTGKVSPESSSDCAEPLYNGVHDVAAVLGYASAEHLRTSMPNATKAQKMEVLVNFLTAITAHTLSVGQNMTLDSIYKLFVTAVKEKRSNASGDTASICSALASRIPALTASIAACQ